MSFSWSLFQIRQPSDLTKMFDPRKLQLGSIQFFFPSTFYAPNYVPGRAGMSPHPRQSTCGAGHEMPLLHPLHHQIQVFLCHLLWNLAEPDPLYFSFKTVFVSSTFISLFLSMEIFQTFDAPSIIFHPFRKVKVALANVRENPQASLDLFTSRDIVEMT